MVLVTLSNRCSRRGCGRVGRFKMLTPSMRVSSACCSASAGAKALLSVMISEWGEARGTDSGGFGLQFRQSLHVSNSLNQTGLWIRDTVSVHDLTSAVHG